MLTKEDRKKIKVGTILYCWNMAYPDQVVIIHKVESGYQYAWFKTRKGSREENYLGALENNKTIICE